MDCRIANDLMMKYMDAILTKKEAEALNGHVCSCESCKEDFMLYGQLVDEFDEESAQLYEPPLDFEDCLMKKIDDIVPDYCKVHSQDTVMGFIFGAFTMIFGAGIIVAMYKDEIMAAAGGYPFVATVMNGATVLANQIMLLGNELTAKLVYYFNNMNALIDTARYGILAIVVALIGVQVFLYSKNKVKV